MITELDNTGELFRLRPEVLLRLQLPDDTKGVKIWAGDDAGAYLDAKHDGLVTVGEAQATARLTVELLERLGRLPAEITVSRAAAELLPERLTTGERHDWTLRFSDRMPGPAGVGPAVLDLHDADDEILHLLETYTDGYSTRPGDPLARRWVGIRDDAGALVACGAEVRVGNPGVPYMASLVTRPDHRGRGYGEALIRERTRGAIAAHGISTVIHFDRNEPIARLYEKLGYTSTERYTCIHYQ